MSQAPTDLALGKGTRVSELLRIGVIGCGDFATRALWPSLRHAPVEIVYACARRPERAQHNKRVFGAQRATTNVDEVLADDTVTALLVIGPPQMQYELGTAALRAGKHIFIEKPPAPTLAQTIELAEAARVAAVQCQIGFQKRFAPGYLWPVPRRPTRSSAPLSWSRSTIRTGEWPTGAGTLRL